MVTNKFDLTVIELYLNDQLDPEARETVEARLRNEEGFFKYFTLVKNILEYQNNYYTRQFGDLNAS